MNSDPVSFVFKLFRVMVGASWSMWRLFPRSLVRDATGRAATRGPYLSYPEACLAAWMSTVEDLSVVNACTFPIKGCTYGSDPNDNPHFCF